MFITDAWHPQVNGVVRTLDSVKHELEKSGMRVSVVYPDRSAFVSVPCPTYPEILLSFDFRSLIRRRILELKPDHIHIATEGPLGLAARLSCQRNKIPFTTSLHTRFPDYVHSRFGFAKSTTYSYMRWFHSAAQRTLVTNQEMNKELSDLGFKNLVTWSRGVDADLFRPLTDRGASLAPKLLYVGRVAIEKNVEAFLNVSMKCEKTVVGEGPLLESFKKRYPEIRFTGLLKGKDLAMEYAKADVFVFPSLTDTFGVVMLEALACGTPIAAFPVLAPRGVLGTSGAGCLDRDIETAINGAMRIPRSRCRMHALNFSWTATAQLLCDQLEPIAEASYESSHSGQRNRLFQRLLKQVTVPFLKRSTLNQKR